MGAGLVPGTSRISFSLVVTRYATVNYNGTIGCCPSLLQLAESAILRFVYE